MAATPPVVAASVDRMARRWKITRSKPTAVIAIMIAETIRVNQAAAGMGVSFLCYLAEELRH
jgi:flavin reductase (DIM6/NTAB) family NADH-FMN oxidoreductase RutF